MINTFLIVAISADGCIAKFPGEPSTNWTSDSDKQFFKERTKQAGVIVMGLKTYETIGKPLPGRLNIVYCDVPKEFPKGVETTSKEPKELLADLEKRGYKEVAICGGSTIYTMFLKSGLLNKIYITVEPVIFGEGMRLFNQKADIQLKLLSSKQLDSNVLLLEYEVINNPKN